MSQPSIMAQASLFAACPRVLIEDTEGGVRYWPEFVARDIAGEWFAQLHDQVPWHSERRPMYHRIVDVPRLMGGYALQDRAAMPFALRAAVDRVRDAAAVPFTHVGLNCYRDGRDSVAPHNDKLHSIVAHHPIALLSLGAPRRMEIRDKQPPQPGAKRRVWRIELEPGSLLLMSHASQRLYDHGIPKTPQPVGPRISLVFRVRPGADGKMDPWS